MNEPVTNECELICVRCWKRWVSKVEDRKLVKKMECPLCHIVGSIIIKEDKNG